MPLGNNALLEPGNLYHETGFRVAARSGLITVIAADADVFAFRNPNVKPIKIARIDVGFMTTTAFTALAFPCFQLHKVVGFSAIHSGGTPTAIDNVIMKRNAGHVDLVSGTDFECVIAGIAALTTATYTAADLDEPIELFPSFCALSGAAAGVATIDASWEPGGLLPFVLDQNEGLILKCTTTMGTAGVGRLFVGIDAHRS